MDHLVLIRVASVLDRRLARGVLRDVLEESRQRLRLVFDGPERTVSLVLSLSPEQPWIGRPVGRWEAPPRHPGPFTARLLRELRKALVAGVEKAVADRRVTLRFADGRALVAELATHGANLVLLDSGGRVTASARRPRSAAKRLAPGELYAPPSLPSRLLDPFSCEAEEIDRFLERELAQGESRFEAVRRRLFGVGTEGARLVLEESVAGGRTVGAVLSDRLARLSAGELDPVIEAPGDPLEAAREGKLDPERVHLLPWKPEEGRPREGRRFIAAADAAATATVYYEALERAAMAARRRAALGAILDREVDRLHQAETASAADMRRFEDPERYRRWGEALLAGLQQAQRVDGNVFVPDPYDPGLRSLAIPDRPGMDLAALADELFRKHRRAERGMERSRARQQRLRADRDRLADMAARHREAGPQAMIALEREMREAGIPVSLERSTKTARAAARLMPLRLEGVRLFVSTEGHSILAGRSGRDNHRLTFKLAGPDDFWFHALGVPGAHVVVRNDEKRSRPSPDTLSQAAAVAAWFSEARGQAAVDVQWTRRKYVRRPRTAPPGTVVLKRFETVRVRPALPQDGGSCSKVGRVRGKPGPNL